MAEDARFCSHCGFVGEHDVRDEITGTQWALLVFFVLCFIVPGVIYALWLWAGGGGRVFFVCPKCGARRASLPLSSPIARSEMARLGIPAPPPRPPRPHPVMKAFGKFVGFLRGA
jgi:hypothetical protein